MTGEKKLHSYIPAFEKQLNQIDMNLLSMEPYCKRYLQHLITHRSYFLSIYAYLLEKLIFHASQPKTSMVLIDYGAGNGLLGIFARFCGFKKVFINDRDASFVEASKELSKAMNLSVEGYITGELTDVRHYFMEQSVPAAMIGSDVIEHIYHLPSFFAEIRQWNPTMCLVFSTASNPENLYKVRQLKKLQLQDEFKGGDPSDAVLSGSEPHASYLSMRTKIIQDLDTTLPINIVQQLALVTRGLQQQDIHQAIMRYRDTGYLPSPPKHPTNTCDPLTGSYTERLLSLAEYQAIFEENGFSLTVYNGFYDEYKKGLKGLINKILNKTIPILGKTIAPFIVFAGKKN